ncbi:MAG TPA: DUF6599 family protein [Terriglobales bacterium]|nr:DUF6599 family protein [Terriglobales bacterium]
MRRSPVPAKLCRVLALSLFLAARAFAADPAAPVKAAPALILPNEFGGWQVSGSIQASPDPAAADPTNPAVLTEYGFMDFAAGTYTRDDGRKLTLRAARFADASGAYGAFTFYKQPEMLNEKIGDQGSSLNHRVLFYRGNVLVDALFDKLSVMSAAELRELASDIPLPQGGARNLPSLPTYLPKQAYVKNTAKYIVGPATLDKIGSPISSQLADFGAGAEIVQGTYESSGGQATLVLISYPTPQIAAEHLRRIDAAHAPNPQPDASAPPVVDVGTFLDKRSGPIVVIAAGPFSPSEAKSLLASVHYDADVTWNENTFFDKKNNLANLLWNTIILCAVLMGITVAVGFAFGGVRVLLARVLSARGGDDGTEFIALHLDRAVSESTGGMRVVRGPGKP